MEFKKDIKCKLKDYKERSREEISKNINKFLGLFKDTSSVLLSTTNGVALAGCKEEMLTCLAQLIRKMNNRADISKEDLKFAFDYAFKDDEKNKKESDNLNKILKESLSELKDLIKNLEKDLKEDNED